MIQTNVNNRFLSIPLNQAIAQIPGLVKDPHRWLAETKVSPPLHTHTSPLLHQPTPLTDPPQVQPRKSSKLHLSNRIAISNYNERLLINIWIILNPNKYDEQ